MFNGADKNLAIPDFVGFRGVDNSLDGGINQIVVKDNLDFHLGQEIDNIFCPAIQLGVAFLAAKALYFDYRKALDTGLL